MATISVDTRPRLSESQREITVLEEAVGHEDQAMGVDLMVKQSPTSVRSKGRRCTLNLNCAMHGHSAADVQDGNTNVPDSCVDEPSWMIPDGNRTGDHSLLTVDSFRRRSTNWIVNNMRSSTDDHSANVVVAATDHSAIGTCSGVVWVETVDQPAHHLDLLVSNSGRSAERLAGRPGAWNSVNRTSLDLQSNNRARTYEDLGRHSAVMPTVQNSKSLDGSGLSFLKCATSTLDGNADARYAAALEEPIHMTLEEVRFSLNGSGERDRTPPSHHQIASAATIGCTKTDKIKQRRIPSSSSCTSMNFVVANHKKQLSTDARCLLPKSLKHTLCHWLGLGKGVVTPIVSADADDSNNSSASSTDQEDCSTVRTADVTVDHGAPGFVNRALPPLPPPPLTTTERHRLNDDSSTDEERDYSDIDDRVESAVLPWWNRISAKSTTDFTSSIQKVKDYGWYWGPISGLAAEAILADEADGSFIVRDSSDEHYIFSLTFKLDGLVRHVRIEHDHGNFSFGTFTKFKSNTIVEFVENAVQHSRSGRYLFFLHRRPILGPMRVQLLHPVSRFKQVQSLQHMCRFAILKVVRRDLIDCLPLPNRLKGYLNNLQYYSEEAVVEERTDDEPGDISHNSNPVTH